MKTYGKEDSIIELGYPRNDYLSNYKDEEISQIRKELGIESVDKKVILYLTYLFFKNIFLFQFYILNPLKFLLLVL